MQAKKDVALIFTNLLRRQIGTRFPTVEYLCTREQILTALMHGYENQDIALSTGRMLHECIVRHEALAKIVLYSPDFYCFFTYIESATFDIASDAFATFKVRLRPLSAPVRAASRGAAGPQDLLTKHKQLCAEFLEKNYDQIFERYQKLLHSENYVTRRQSLKVAVHARRGP